MSIATEISRLQVAKAGLKTAIEGKGVTVSEGATLDAYPALVESISIGGGTSVTYPQEVNFLDYDGVCLYSYTIEELQALTELPPLPTHEGLLCQGWNWTLADLKAAGRAMDVAPMYITNDGKTRLFIAIAAPGRYTVPLYFTQTVANGVTIDWGDGSTAQTLSGIGKCNTTHTYGAVGDYVITLTVADGCQMGFGQGSTSCCVMGPTGNMGRVYCNMLQKVEIGGGVTSIDSYAFRYCHSLSSVTIPPGVTSIGEYAFYQCYSLSSITIPSSVTSIGSNAFYQCYSLSSITIPSGVTSIGEYAFSYCNSLSSITIPSGVASIGSSAFSSCNSLSSVTIPSSVTSIGSNAFNQCHGVAEYHLLSETPPSLTNVNAFSGIASDCVIYIPEGSLSDYQAATNWATYAAYMQEEPV